MRYLNKISKVLLRPFIYRRKLHIPLFIVFLIINCLVLVNAILHHPGIGYDSEEHRVYIKVLSEGRLPKEGESRQYYSPPLPYIIPAFLTAVLKTNLYTTAKIAQLVNVLLSVVLTYFLINICRLVSQKPSFALGTLGFLGILPVYYRSFAFIRGEPYAATIAILILYFVLKAFILKRITLLTSIILGFLSGLYLLTRQTGIFIFIAVLIFIGWQWLRYPINRQKLIRTAFVYLLVTVITSGWFYAHLNMRYGSAGTFNVTPETPFSLKNQPAEFYFGTSLGTLFSKPIRPHIVNQFLPIFYSDIWGDYWAYFVVFGARNERTEFIAGELLTSKFYDGKPHPRIETNYPNIGAFLGRVNIVSIFPSLIALISLIFPFTMHKTNSSNYFYLSRKVEFTRFVLLAIIISMMGFIGFLIRYPRLDEGDPIKATYVLHIFPYLAVLVGTFLEYVEQKSKTIYNLILIGLVLTFFHNLPAMVTHYSRIHFF